MKRLELHGSQFCAIGIEWRSLSDRFRLPFEQLDAKASGHLWSTSGSWLACHHMLGWAEEIDHVTEAD
jgi:hypothetical protein